MPKSTRPATVSVLLPTYNRARYIAEAIESVLNQSHVEREVIVLDDGSTDETPEVCAGFGSAIRYVRIETNGGKTAAINLGLGLAQGDFIWVVDDDDIVPPDALASLLGPLVADPDLGFAFGGLRKFTVGKTGKPVFETTPDPTPPGPRQLFVRLMEDCFITGQPCTLFRKRCLDETGPFDPSVVTSVDYNILLQVARRHGGADTGKIVLWQRQHEGLRGPQTLRYRRADRVRRWQDSDARLLAGLLPDLRLEEFLGDTPSPGQLSFRQMRRAFLQKAVIAGRKDLWDMAADSLQAARALSRQRPLDGGETQMLSRMLGSRYGIDAFLKSGEVQRKVAAAAGNGPLGQEIRLAIAAMLTFWAARAARRGDIVRAFESAVALLRLSGPVGGASLVARAIAKRVRLVAPARGGHARPAEPNATHSSEGRSTNTAG